MFKKATVAAALVTLSLVWVLSAQNDAQTVINNSMKSMGSQNLKTLVYSGEGFDSCVGQGADPDGTWRLFANKNYVRSIDFDAKGWRMQRLRTEPEGLPAGTGGCSAGPYTAQQQNTVTLLTGNSPWNTQLDFIMLPQGFLRVAAAMNPAVSRQGNNTVVSFKGANGADVKGYINGQGYVEKVETTIAENVLGDITYDAVFTGWRDFNGVKFPTKIVQRQWGRPFFEVNIATVQPNAPVSLEQEAKGKGRGAPGGGFGKGKDKGGPPPNLAEKLSDKAYLITGGYGAIVVDMGGYVAIAGAGNSEQRTDQLISEANRLFPGKQVRYVLNTHAHHDHAGGLRAWVAAGVTIVTHQKNRAYYQKALTNPSRLNPGKLEAANMPAPKFEFVGDRHVMSSNGETIEMHTVRSSLHNVAMQLIYLPNERVVLEADEFNVGGQAPTAPPGVVNPYHSNFLANIERLRLNVDRIVPIHLPGDGRAVTMAELRTMAGRPN